MRVTLLLIAPLVAAALPAARTLAQPTARAADDSADRYVAAEMRRQHIPGVALAIVRGGRVVRAKGYGFADVEDSVPVTPRTVFKIGSVSKQFIATGILLLVQDGRIAIDDPVAKHITGTPVSWKGITIRNLLTHTSGIRREGPAFDALKVQPDIDVIRSAFDSPLEFETGSKYQYCNVCYFTLAEIVRVVSGKPWSDFLDERVFKPLGMSATRTTTTSAVVPHRADGYGWRNDTLLRAPELLALRPSGAFLSTVLDLARWDSTLYTDRVLTRTTREQMWTPVRLSTGASHPYGFGWVVDSLAGRRRAHHGGSLPGFRSYYSRFIDDSLSVIVLTNGDNANPQRIADAVSTIYLSQLRRQPATR